MKEFVLQGGGGSGQLKINYEVELNQEQLPVVQNGDGATLVLAGAGSGKTRTITYRVAWLLEHGVRPDQILLLTFTNKASREMIERVEHLLGSYPSGLWAGTFHSVANRLLRKYAVHLGYQPNFSILDQEDAKDLFSLCVKELKIDTKGKRFPNAGVLQALFSFQRNKSCTLEQAVEAKHPKFLPILADIEAVTAMYTRLKQQQNAMDFDDLLLKLLELLTTRPDVADQLSTQFLYLLVDEFQDTNVVQAEIVERLSRAHRNILVVGDDAQSIYSFRAAEIQNILRFPQMYGETKTFRLTTNYRSTPQILSVANAVIANNEHQFEKELEAVVADGEKPCVVPAANDGEQAQYIAEQILTLHGDGVPLKEIAVLFRAAFHSQSLEFELMKRDIPYDYRGGMKFFERSHVKDVVAHLRIIHNVKDGMAWVRVLRLQPGLGLVTAGKIARACADLEEIREVKSFVPVSGKKALAGWQGAVRVVNDLLAARPFAADYIRTLAANTDYQAYLESEFPNFRDRLDDLEQFAIFAEQFEALGDFLEAVSLTDEFSAAADRYTMDVQDKIVLSTIHQAKGLEWDAVFVMHLKDGSFPNKKASDEDGGLEEERRLFYVATTRARKRLFLTYPLTSGYQHVEICQPSIFLDEIPGALVEQVKLRRSMGDYQSAVSHERAYSDGYDEPSIVLDEDGERVRKERPTSFLGDY